MEILAWCASGNDNACAADNLEAKLDDIVEEAWTKLDRTQIGLPSAGEIMVADGKTEEAYLDYPTLTNSWLYDYPSLEGYTGGGGPVYGYWTSTPNADYSDQGWVVYCGGNVNYYNVDYDDSFGIRPVITLSI